MLGRQASLVATSQRMVVWSFPCADKSTHDQHAPVLLRIGHLPNIRSQWQGISKKSRGKKNNKINAHPGLAYAYLAQEVTTSSWPPSEHTRWGGVDLTTGNRSKLSATHDRQSRASASLVQQIEAACCFPHLAQAASSAHSDLALSLRTLATPARIASSAGRPGSVIRQSGVIKESKKTSILLS